MREFRGIDIITGEWIFGSLIVDEYGNYYIGKKIVPTPSKEMWFLQGRRSGKLIGRFVGIGFKMVIPESVGRDTGMADALNQKIFEGDILCFEKYNGVVEYSELFAKYRLIYSQHSGNWFDFEGKNGYPISHDGIVIGNKFEHPNLLEREGKIDVPPDIQKF